MITKFPLHHYNFINQLEKRRRELTDYIEISLNRLKKAPPEFLRISKTHGKNHYYSRNKGENNGTYISNNNISFIAALAQKKYDLCFIQNAEKELKAINTFLDSYSYANSISNINKTFTNELLNMIETADMPDEDYKEYWLSIPYEPKYIGEDTADHITANNERVRSKSEELIANTLYRLGIPYKYECPILLNDGRYRYPDFTILDIKTRKEYYFEHYGMMDNADYVGSFMKKMRIYEANGICPGINLIMTFESSDCPINTHMIEKIIKSYINIPEEN